MTNHIKLHRYLTMTRQDRQKFGVGTQHYRCHTVCNKNKLVGHNRICTTGAVNVHKREQKPRLHMAHFKRTRLCTEPGAWPRYAPVYTIGAGHRANSIINMAALNFRHVVRVLIAFLKFRRCRELRWLVCNNYENSNLKKLFDVALFVNYRRHNSADLHSPHCVVILAFL